MQKSSKAAVTQRVQDVYRLMLAGAEFAEIAQHATDKGWHVPARQLRRYMEMAYKRLAKTAERDRMQLLGRHLGQRRALYARAIKAGDVKTALHVLRDEAELQGLYPSTRHDVSGRLALEVVEEIVVKRVENPTA